MRIMYSKYKGFFLNGLIGSICLPIMLIISFKEFSYIYIFLILELMQYLEYNYVLVCCALLANFLCFEVSLIASHFSLLMAPSDRQAPR